MHSTGLSFSAWLDQFFGAYYRRRPVNATFIGLHTFDGTLPDFGEDGSGDTLAELHSLRRQLALVPAHDQTIAESMDRQLVDGFIQIQEWEMQSQHFQRGNPSLYTGEAAFGIISLLRRPFAPVRERLASVRERLDVLPRLFEQAQTNVLAAPTAWTERAIDECTGIINLLRDGLALFVQAHGFQEPVFGAERERALAAVVTFQHYLETELSRHPRMSYGCGESAFHQLLKRGYFLDQDAAEISAFGREQMSEAAGYLSSHARDFGARSSEEAIAGLAAIHPLVDDYYARYAANWQACRSVSEAHQLVTWPETPVTYVPRPSWIRAAAPHLYFLFYHAPAPFDRLERLEYLVTPVDAQMPMDEQRRLLRANNDSVIKLNHVVHHGALGHHVQNCFAARAASRIGQIAAVDCASRVAMFCGGILAEGWACYATDLMDEFGFLTGLETYAQYHGRLRMAARAVVDVELHAGRMSLEQAADFYRQRVGMTPLAARAEAVKNSMFPGTGLMYLMGTHGIKELRQELAPRPGFSLRAFHDTLLSHGSVPVALIAQAMRKEHSHA
ncbi:MAG: hypothetical protein NVS4B8_04000 [Herpetosiphon sp.]